MSASFFWTSSSGDVTYGGAGIDGLEWRRHGWICEPGKYKVGITGWSLWANAVVDDFGNLVEVR